MSGAWQRIDWREEVAGRQWSATYLARDAGIGCVWPSLGLCAAASGFLAFVVGAPNVHGGGVPIVGMLMLAVPPLALGVLLTVGLWRELHRRVTLVLRAGESLEVHTTSGVSSFELREVGGFVVSRSLILIVRPDGKHLHYLPGLGAASRFALPRLEAALEWARAPRDARY